MPSFSALIPTITSIALHKQEYSHLGILATGSPDGSIMLLPSCYELVLQMVLWKKKKLNGASSMKVGMLRQSEPSAIIALKFLG